MPISDNETLENKNNKLSNYVQIEVIYYKIDVKLYTL